MNRRTEKCEQFISLDLKNEMEEDMSVGQPKVSILAGKNGGKIS